MQVCEERNANKRRTHCKVAINESQRRYFCLMNASLMSVNLWNENFERAFFGNHFLQSKVLVDGLKNDARRQTGLQNQ